MPSLSQQIKTKKRAMPKQPPHLIVEALAGTGKTTTLIEGLKILKGEEPSIQPSIQQLAIWEEMEKSRDAKSVCFMAFNKSIAEELEQRVPAGCSAMTLHKMGLKSVLSTFNIPNRGIGNRFRTQDIIADLLGKDLRELKKKDFTLIQATEKLVGLCKLTLSNDLEWITNYYDIDINSHRQQVFDLVPSVLERCMEVDKDKKIDFEDMIWLPIVLGLPIFKYDLLLVDESQDLCRCQQELARKAGRRIILVGDSRQAIYGFAGADAASMQRMKIELTATEEGCKVLPLTVTRRCGKAIVNEAKKIVPTFEAHESNGEGLITRLPYEVSEQQESSKKLIESYHANVQLGDFLVCRVTAPLVSQCFRFIKQGRKAEIIGRDIGTGLINLIKKMKADTVSDLIGKLDDWLAKEKEKEQKRCYTNEARLIAIHDRYDCLICFTEEAETVEEVISKIQSVFTDNEDGDSQAIRLSTIHKAKGLEADRVFLLEPKGSTVPHPMAKKEWELEQEWNLRYVAITRAIKELVYVS